MKNFTKSFILLLTLTLGLIGSVGAQTYYTRTTTSTNWNATAGWSTASCGGAVATTTPSTSAQPVNICTASKTTTVTANVSCGALTITNGTLVINTGVTLSVASLTMSAGTLTISGTGNLFVTGDVNITGGTYTAGGGVITMAGAAQNIASTQALNNLTISGNGNKTMTGNLTASTIDFTTGIGNRFLLVGNNTLTVTSVLNALPASRALTLSSTSPYSSLVFGGTAVTDLGALISNATDYNLNNLTVGTGMVTLGTKRPIVNGTLTVGTGDLTIGTNTLTLNGPISTAVSSFIIGSNTVASNLTIGGSGAATVYLLNSTTGQTINDLVINRAGGVAFPYAVIVSNSLQLLDGAANFTGGSLTFPANPISITRTAGSITGVTPTFNASAQMSYFYGLGGATSITTGVELTTNTSILKNFTVNTTGTITLGASPTINTTLAFTAGKLALGANTLTIGSGSSATTTITGTSVSNCFVGSGSAGVLILNGNGAMSNLFFDQGTPSTTNRLGTLTINSSTNLTRTLGNSLVVGTSLTLTNGDLAIGANTLTLNGNTSGNSATNSLIGSTTSNLTIAGSGALANLFFDQTGTNNNLATFLINRTGVTVTMGSNIVVGTNLDLTAGKLAIANNTLTLNGTVSNMSATNCLVGATTSSNALTIGGTGALGTLYFDNTTPGTTDNIYQYTQNRSTSGTVDLGSDMSISSQFAFGTNGGLFILGTGADLNMKNGSNFSGTPGVGKMVVTSATSGYLTYAFSSSNFSQGFTYPIGDNVGTPEFNSFTFTENTSGSTARVIGWKVIDGIHPSMNTPTTPTNYITRYYNSTITPSTGTYTYTVDLPYNGTGGDIVGTDASVGVVTWDGSAWDGLAAQTNITSDVFRFTSTSANQTSAPLGVDVVGRKVENDEPCGAITVTPGAAGAGCTNTVTASSTGSSQTFSGSTCGTAEDDVWFKFTATATSHVVRVTPSASYDPSIQCYYNAACGSISSSSNITTCSNGSAGVVIEQTLTGLTINNVYYVRVWDWSSSIPATTTFDICVITPPANDQPCGAIDLTPAVQTCNAVTGSTYLATQTFSGTSCAGTADDDVWYKFTLPAGNTSATVRVVGNANFAPVVQGYYNAACGSIVSTSNIGTCDYSFSDGGTAEMQLTGLTPLNTYYVRVYDYNTAAPSTASFDICVMLPPANDNVCGAVDLTPAIQTCNSTSGNSYLASQTFSGTSCGGTADDDVWYKFTLPVGNTSATVRVVGGSTFAPAVQGYYNAACGGVISTSNIGTCDVTTTDGGTVEMQLTGLTGGLVYYVRVYDYWSGSDAASTFNICVMLPPANDNVCGAVDLTPAIQTCNPTAGNTYLASQTFSGTSCGGTADDDVWYKFTLPAGNTSATVRVVGGSTFAPAVQGYYNAACGSVVAGSTIGTCDVTTTDGGTVEMQLTGLTAGNTYFVRVYDYWSGSASTSTFNICVMLPPANNDVCGAVSLTPASSCTPTSGSTYLASQTFSGSSCGGTADDDVWYKFTVPVGYTSVNVTVDGGASFAPVVQAYYNAACGGVIASSNIGTCQASTTDGAIINMPLTGLTAGNTYFVRVYDYWSGSDAASTFDICVVLPPANDVCSGATLLTCGGSVTGGTSGATDDVISPTCGGTGNNFKGLWHYITPTAGQVVLSLCSGTTYDTYMRVYSGACGSLTCVASDDDGCGTLGGPSEISFFANGSTTYRILVTAYSSSGTGTYTLSANCYPTPGNDNCAGTNLVLNAAATSGTVLGATQTLSDNYGPGYDDDDVWYNFTPTSTNATITLVENNTTPIFDGVLELRSSAACPAVRIQARDFTVGGAGTETMRVSGLTTGVNYKVRVFSYQANNYAQGPFTIQVTDNAYTPAANDNVCNATVVTTSATGNANASYGFQVGEPAGANWGYDVDTYTSVPSNTQWFKFSPTSTGSYTISASMSSGIQVAVYSAASNLCSNILVAGSRTEIASGYSTVSTPVTLSALCLTSGVDYYIQLNGDMGSTGTPSLTITNNNPAVPVVDAITTFDCTSFTATWPAVTNATGYRVDVATNPGFSPMLVTDFNNGTSTSYSGSGLTPGQIYYVRVRTEGACTFVSGNSNAPSITLPAIASQPGAYTTSTTSICAPQTGITYTVPFVSGVTYNWSYTGSNVTINGTGNSVTLDFAANATSGTLSVTATNSCGTSTTSRDVAITVNPSPVAPTFNSPVTTICQNSSATYNATSTSGTVTYSIVAGTATINSTTGVLTSTGSTNFTVRATATTGSCGALFTDQAVTVNPLPGTVVATAGTGATTTSIVANWGAAANATSYILEVSTVNNFASTVFNSNVGNVTTYTVNTPPLTPGTTYYYRVTAVNACGNAAVSNTITYATLPPLVGSLTWDGSTSTDWNDITNWTPQQIPTAADDILIPNVANDPALSTGANGVCKNVTINSGALLSIGTGKTIDVKGDWNGANNTVSGAGDLIFSGAAAQSITGGAIINNLQINNTNGVTVTAGANMVTVSTALKLVLGQLTTNGNITIRSVSGLQAYIDDFSGSNAGTLSGNVKVERYITSGPNGFRYIGAPVNTGGNTMNLSAISGFIISGTPGQLIPLPTCSPNNSASNSPYGTLMRWEEAGPYLFGCRQSGWWFQTTGTMTVGRGYGAKLAGGNKITYTGAANTGTSPNYTCTSTNVFAPALNGWNLVSNPFPSNIRIDETDGNANNDMPAGFDGQVQFYQTSGPYTGTYVTFNVGVASPPILPIALGQGFWVKVSNTGTANWSLTNDHRITTGATYYSTNAVEQHLNVTISGNGFMDQTDINFMPEATPGFDFYDANKWQSANGQPTLFTSVGEEMLSINSNPSLTNTVAIPMGLMPGADGTFTFTFNDIASFPLSAMITLEDLFTNTITDLRQTNTYTFSSLETDSTDRFIIHFQPGVTASVVDQDCENATGSITYTQNGTTVWSTYSVKDNSNNTYAQGNNYTGTITVNNLLPQEYILNLTHSSGYTAQEFITVNSHGVPVTVGLTASDTTITMGDMVTLTATATNATGYNWNFGDGNSITGSTSQQHTYALPGNYTAIITASNDSCSKADSVVIHVADTTTGINNHTASTLTIYGQGERVVVQFNNWGGNKADIFMYNTLGQRVESLTGVSTIKGRQELNVAGIKPGYYLIQVVSDGKIQSQKIYLGNY